MNPNDRTVIIRLPRRYVTRLLVMVKALADSDDPENIRRAWREIYDELTDDLRDHDLKWGRHNAI